MTDTIKKLSHYFCIGIICLIGVGCNTNKHLVGEQRYVAKSKINIDADEKINQKSDLAYKLSLIDRQKPNAKFLQLARLRLWQHYRIQEKGDSTKFNQWIKRVVAEEPSIMDSLLVQQSAEDMDIFLQRQGYFNATVEPTIKSRKYTAVATYDIDLKKIYTIDSLSINCKDSSVLALIEASADQSYLKKGQPVSYENYEKERNRIRNLLRNSGYAKFQNNFISSFTGDTISTDGKYKVNLSYDIVRPTDTTNHQTYQIGKIVVIPQYEPGTSPTYLLDSMYYGYYFRIAEKDMKINPQIIVDNIELVSGSLYRQSDQDLTTLQLSNLGVYRFVTLRPSFPEDRPEDIDFEIVLTLGDKQTLRMTADVNTINRTTAGGSLVGTAFSISNTNNNFLGGAEKFRVSGEVGVEINPTNSNNILGNITASIETGIQFPKFKDYIGFWKSTANKEKKQKEISFFDRLKSKATRDISLRYNFINLTNFYSLSTFQASYGWSLSEGGNTWNLTHAGVDFVNSRIDPDFRATTSPLLINSLDPQFLTGFIIKEFSTKRIKLNTLKNITKTTNLRLEQSGLEIFALESIIGNEFNINDQRFSKFLSASFDYSRVKELSYNQSFATRFFAGIVQRYGQSEVVPFVKQFNAGGANSMRAWQLYRLGPGSLDNQSIEAGTLKLEANAEYRFDVIGRLKSALFVDIGNVWKIDDDARSETLFQLDPLDIWNKIAIAVGTGARIDFTYFIFRVDIGFKLKDPARALGQQITPLRDYFARENRNISIGLGYPF